MPKKSTSSFPAAKAPLADGWSIAEPVQSQIEADGRIVSFVITRTDTATERNVFASTVDLTTINDKDFVRLTNKKITFAVGEASKTVTVTLKDDTDVEFPETYGLIIEPTRNSLAKDYLSVATFQIKDNDTNPFGTSATNGNDQLRLIPALGEIELDALDGNDHLTIDFSSFSQDVQLTTRLLPDFSHQWVAKTSDNSHLVAIEGVESFTFLGGSGNDTVFVPVNSCDSFLSGGAGHDRIVDSTGNDVIFGGANSDSLTANAGKDVVRGGTGDDTIVVGEGGADVIDGGAGSDRLVLTRSNATIAFDFVFDATSSDILALADGTLISNVEKFIFRSGSGDDTIAFKMTPTVKLPPNVRDHQEILGGAGEDHAVVDYSVFNKGMTFYYSTFQSAFIAETNSNSQILNIREVESFTVLGGSRNDSIITHGNAANDIFKGGDGNDFLDAGKGEDIVRGGNGDDQVIVGKGGKDAVFGGDGLDTLTLSRQQADTAFDFTFNAASNKPLTLHDGTKISNFELLNFTAGSGDDFIRYKLSDEIDGRQDLFTKGGIDHVTLDYSSFNENLRILSFTPRKLEAQSIDGGHILNIHNAETFTIVGGSLSDRIGTLKRGGNDTLIGGAGHDVLYSGNGDDIVRGGFGDDHANSGNGDDYVNGGAGGDHLNAGQGNDQVFGGSGSDRINVLGEGADFVHGGSGVDTLVLQRGKSEIDFEFTFTCGISNFQTLADGMRFESIERLIFRGGYGDDNITLKLTSDFTVGGDVTGGRGSDHVTLDYSDISAPIFLFSNSAITLTARTLDFKYESNITFVESLTFIGTTENDFVRITSEGTRFTLFGRGGDDVFETYARKDILDGGKGNDTLNAGAGQDVIRGGNGNDILTGGTGKDTLLGGEGDDVLHFTIGDGADTIEDFNDGNDTIELDGHGLTAVQALAAATQVATDVVIDLGGGDVIKLLNTDLASLSVDDFSIV